MSSTEQKPPGGTSLFVTMTTDIEKSPWYNKDITSLIRPETHELLTKYAGVSPEDIIEHVKSAVSNYHLLTITHSAQLHNSAIKPGPSHPTHP